MNNRILTFRAWYNDKMYQLEGIDFPEHEVFLTGIEEFKSIFFDEVVLMQFIDIYDSSNKQIFEGDILENRDNERFVVKWNQGSFWAVKEKDGVDVINMFEPFILSKDVVEDEKMKIIGNKYENPDLLI